MTKLVKSALTENKLTGLSERYQHFSTKELIDTMASFGFSVARSTEKRVKDPARHGFQAHEIRFQSGDQKLNVGDSALELLVRNSHDGKSSLQIGLGIFRLICSNGLTVGRMLESIRIRHVEINRRRIGDALEIVMNQAESVKSRIVYLDKIELSQDQASALASKVMDARLDAFKSPTYDVNQVLRARRYNDNKNTAWGILNRVQESVIRGGVPFQYVTEEKTDNGVILLEKRSHTREIKSPDQVKALNDLVIDTTLEMVA